MADLFERLIARAAGGTSAVRPQREVSDVLFVATGIDREDDIPPEAAGDEASERRLPAHRETRDRPAREDRRDRPVPPPTPRTELDRSADTPRPAATPHPAALPAALEHPATVRTVRPVDDVAARLELGTASSRAASTARRSAAPSDAAMPPADVPARASLPESAPVISHTAPVPASVGPVPETPRIDRNPGAAQHPPTRRVRTVSPRAAAPVAPEPSRGVEEAAPVIRISIGRIDVRATTPRAPAASAPRTEPAQPQLTLDAFLARTGHGGRR